MGKKVNLDDLKNISGGGVPRTSVDLRDGGNAPYFTNYTPEEVANLKIGDSVSVIRGGNIYDCHVFMESMDGGQTIDVRGGGLPNDFQSASYLEVGPSGQVY